MTPAERVERVEVVVDMVAYLREFIAKIDEAVNPWLAKRQELAIRCQRRAKLDPLPAGEI